MKAISARDAAPIWNVQAYGIDVFPFAAFVGSLHCVSRRIILRSISGHADDDVASAKRAALANRCERGWRVVQCGLIQPTAARVYDAIIGHLKNPGEQLPAAPGWCLVT